MVPVHFAATEFNFLNQLFVIKSFVFSFLFLHEQFKRGLHISLKPNKKPKKTYNKYTAGELLIDTSNIKLVQRGDE